MCVTDDDGVREITTSADDTAAFRPGLIAVSHGTGDSQLHERGKHAAVRAVISDCSFSSTCAEFAYHLRARHLPARLILPLASQMCRMLAGYHLTQASPLDAVAHAAVPVLLIHGGADTYNPTAMAHELHAAQPHADLWIVPGADHVMSYFTDPGAYRKRVEQFLRRLPPQGTRRDNVTSKFPLIGIMWVTFGHCALQAT